MLSLCQKGVWPHERICGKEAAPNFQIGINEVFYVILRVSHEPWKLIMNSWNGFDFFIFLILASNAIYGMSRGAAREVISMMCLSAALIFSIKFTVPLANFFNSSSIAIHVVDNTFTQNFMIGIGAGPLTTALLNQIMYSLSLLICFVGVFSACEAGLSKTDFAAVFTLPFAMLNWQLGGVLGFTRGYIISLMFISIMAFHLYEADSGGNFISGSFFAGLFQSQAQKFDSFISSQRPENYNQLYQNQPYDVKELYKNLSKPELPQPSQP